MSSPLKKATTKRIIIHGNRTHSSPEKGTSKQQCASEEHFRNRTSESDLISSSSSSRMSPPSLSEPRSRGSQNDESELNFQSIISSDYSTEDNINVVVRVRPLNNKERKSSSSSSNNLVVQFPGNGQILCEGISGAGSAQKSKLFSFNVVFEPDATQSDVLEYSGVKRLIEMAVEGFSCTAFCYGQTGSGKTHTLTGPPHPDDDDDQHGLIIRSFNYLFLLLQQDQPEINYILKASFLEIYNEKVIDLLNGGGGTARKPLSVRWSKKIGGFFVENLFTVDCEQLDDLMAVLEEGMKNRSVGCHSMNDYSSRSHTILTVHIHSEQPAENGVFLSRQGKINFVDLAGSEMTKKTHSQGKTLEEANNINKSLMVLGSCISSLSDSKKKNGHIPYRDSKLTKLLADSLAGNGVTLMIACISPARSNMSETLNTLRYAARAKKIRTKPIVIMDPREALILSLKREVNVLKQENVQLRAILYWDNNNEELQFSTAEKKYSSQVDVKKLAELEGSQLAELVRLYMQENEALRKENAELQITKEIIIRDQELVCRENERLLKKLEDVNSVCCRSPIIPARPAFSAEMLNKSATSSELDASSSIQIWTNPSEKVVSSSSSANRSVIIMPQSIQKELEKRQIGNGNRHIRHSSWNGHHETENKAKKNSQVNM